MLYIPAIALPDMGLGRRSEVLQCRALLFLTYTPRVQSIVFCVH